LVLGATGSCVRIHLKTGAHGSNRNPSVQEGKGGREICAKKERGRRKQVGKKKMLLKPILEKHSCVEIKKRD